MIFPSFRIPLFGPARAPVQQHQRGHRHQQDHHVVEIAVAAGAGTATKGAAVADAAGGGTAWNGGALRSTLVSNHRKTIGKPWENGKTIGKP